MDDKLISLNTAIDAVHKNYDTILDFKSDGKTIAYSIEDILSALPPTQPERLTDDDFETIRIHLSAFKERLCNQRRWKEAEDYERLIGRFISFASSQPEVKPIDYQDCANAMLKMWMDNVVTDGEYNRIMDKLNAYWRKRNG